MEVKISAENLVGALTAKHHLYAHAFYHAGQQIHWRGSANSGDIVGFNEIYHIADGIETFLDGIVDFVVHGAYMVGHFACLCQVGCPFQTNGK